MRLIDRNDIELWATKIDSKGYFPILLSRLVKATTSISTLAEFPSGTASNIGGWDGIVICEENCGYVPQGISLWEFGTEKSVTAKAEKDYKKRSADPLDYDQKNSTYIFITPRFWKEKENFRKQKLKDNIWRDVRTYDSRNLEEWIDEAAAVSRWFAPQLSKIPVDGVITTDEFWKEWAFSPMIEFPPSIVTAGRERECQELFDFLAAGPDIKGIRASTKDEAIAFIIASAKQFEKQHHDRFFSKTLIVDKEHSFRTLRSYKHKLNLITKIGENKISYSGVVDGHHVLIPLGADDPFNNTLITLPDLPREGQIDSLMNGGLSEEEAKKMSREAARNLTVLRRLLKFPQDKIEWLDVDHIQEIIPALLVGRWSEGNTGDISVLETLSGLSYSEYQDLLFKWRDLPGSPIIQIGHTWRLTSPLDAWSNIGPFLNQSDFEQLKKAVQNIIGIVEKEEMVQTHGFDLGFRKPKKFSRWLREGLLQSLILVGLYGDALKLSIPNGSQDWVDDIVRRLLENADDKLWVSLDHEMPLIAEAAPIVFLDQTNLSLLSEKKSIMGMFVSKAGVFMDSPNHTGLLWGLESLAWMPEYLLDATIVLSRIAKLKPEIKMVNQPINSLREIYKSWHFQTLAEFDQRVTGIKAVIDIDHETGWTLLLSLLPQDHAVAHPTHKLRWRMFSTRSELDYTYDEIFRTHSAAVSMLIENFNESEQDLAVLVDRSEKLGAKDRKHLLDFVESVAETVPQREYLVWKELGKTLSQHRSHPSAKWALPEAELLQYEKLYKIFEPSDPMVQYLSLFNEHWPEFPQGRNKRDPAAAQEHGEEIEKRRIEAANYVYLKFGIIKFRELAATVKEPWILGQILAKTVGIEFEKDDLTFFLNSAEGSLKLIQGFFARKATIHSPEWSLKLLQKLQSENFSDTELSKILVVLQQSVNLWKYLEEFPSLAAEYWKIVNPFFYHLSVEEKLIGLQFLLKYKRFFSAIDEAVDYIEHLPDNFIVELLTKSATDSATDERPLPVYEIGRIFEYLHNQPVFDENNLIRLEWLYIDVLDPNRSGRSPKFIFKEMLRSPEFFVEILKWVYMPSDEEESIPESLELTSEQMVNRATRAYSLLRNLKGIPGLHEDGTFEGRFLVEWVTQVRSLADKAGRIQVADSELGKILAGYPEDGSINWPPEPIRKLIEDINTDNLKSGFSSETFNKRGSSTRGPFDGGGIERRHAQYFDKLAINCRVKYPNLAIIFSRLAKGYQEDAKKMDEQAERDKLDH